MNPKHVQAAINVMKRAKARGGELYMSTWQATIHTKYTEEEVHNCGTACCFAGWLAVSPEFHEVGGSVSTSGVPVLNNLKQAEAIASYLEIPLELSELLTMTADSADEDDGDVNTEFYGVDLYRDVTFDMVIEKLELILKGELA